MPPRSNRLRRSIRRSALALSLVSCGAADAATIVVDHEADELAVNGHCSLREAIRAANADAAQDACTPGSGDDVIVLPAGTYLLAIPGANEDFASSGDLDVRASLDIRGAGADVTVVDAAALDRVIDIQASNVTLSLVDVSVRGGRLTGSGANGAAIRAGFPNARIEIERCAILANTIDSSGPGTDAPIAARGGAIYATTGSVIEIRESEISGNRLLSRPLGSQAQRGYADGGAIFSFGVIRIVSSTISGNAAVVDGSGCAIQQVAAGGGLYVSGTAALFNVTVANNEARADGGGCPALSASASGGGVASFNSVVATHVVLAGNFGTNGQGGQARNCSNALISHGFNLSSDTSCVLSQPTDLTGADAKLGPLQDNGGPTFSHDLGSGSAAIDSGDPIGCLDETGAALAADQRGYVRPFDAGGGAVCDRGAIEHLSSLPTPTPTSTPTPAPEPTPTETPTPEPTAASTPTLSAVAVCEATPRPACAAAEAGSLQITDKGTPERRRLLWKIRQASSAAPSFGDPVAGTTSYALCVYVDGARVGSAIEVLPGGLCGASPCWRSLGTRGQRYDDRAATHGPVRSLVMRRNGARARIVLEAAGAGLPAFLPLAPAQEATVQLVSDPASGSGCWGATFAVPPRKSTSGRYEDRL